MFTLILLSYACGLLMLLMPCTLPVIGLKLAAFKGSNVSYVVGVMAAFTVLGLLAGVLGMGLSHMSNWYYRLVLACVCVAVAFQFMGLVKLPTFGTTSNSPFFLGLLSVALGSSCTVPFIAPVLIAAAKLPLYQTCILFWVMGIGFVTPFLLPIHKLLPKPGVWMLWYERGCGIVMLLVAAWLGSTLLTNQTHVPYPTDGPRAIVVTGDFCLNCKVVEPLWHRENVQKALEGYQFVTLDWTNGDDYITEFLDGYGIRAIPFALVVNEKGEETILTGIYSEQDILEAL